VKRLVPLVLAIALLAAGCAAGEGTADDAVATTTELQPAATPSQIEVGTVIDEATCAATPTTPACAQFLDDLSDAEFCAILPADRFCIEFFDPNAEADSAASNGDGDEDSPGRISLDGIGRLRPGTDAADDPTAEEVASSISDPSLRRSDGLCLPRDRVSEWANADYDTAHQVVDGTLGAICHGMPDPRIDEVWAVVHDIAPPELAARVAVFAGYFNETATDRSRVGSAFVRPVGSDGDFLMAYNLADLGRTSQDPSVIVAHELAHVIANGRDQIAGPPTTDCPHYVDGHGCRRSDAIMTRWAADFWAGVEVFNTADAVERCENDNGFFGDYAATEPAEDFAEAVAAYVTGIRAESAGQQDRLDFLDGIASVRALRDRAQAGGYEAAWYPFTICG
jgi:hypothetical protein